MTYNEYAGTINLAQSINLCIWCSYRLLNIYSHILLYVTYCAFSS